MKTATKTIRIPRNGRHSKAGVAYRKSQEQIYATLAAVEVSVGGKMGDKLAAYQADIVWC